MVFDMDIQAVLLIGIIFFLVIISVILFLLFSGGKKGVSDKGRLNRIVQSQRKSGVSEGTTVRNHPGIHATAEEEKVDRATSARLTLEKKLKYAQWSLPPVAYYSSMLLISIVVVFIVHLKFDAVITVISVAAGPIFMGWLINSFIEHRFKSFDKDYPAFLSSVVSLLKTGMDSTSAMEMAAKGLDEGSLVKEEILLMIERLRFGVSEEKSIGSFGEDIYHPEIELFVQALLLSRRVGGNLSETLNRLAKQVRKRQYFRKSAKAAVGMQRGSIWIIVGIMAGMELYLYLSYPDIITESLENPMGWQVWQGAIVCILGGIFWVRQVTKMKI